LEIKEDRVFLPGWLIIERWLYYYYPVFSSAKLVSQIYGGHVNESIRKPFLKIIAFYQRPENNGMDHFFADLNYSKVPTEIRKDFIDLCDQIHSTVIKNPMKYLGRSISGGFYNVFDYERKFRKRKIAGAINTYSMVNRYCNYHFSQEYFEIFQVVGEYILGSGAIIQKWADFTVSANREKNPISKSEALEILTSFPRSERNVLLSKKLFLAGLREKGELLCVWSSKKVSNENALNIDHVIPFSLLRNNDLWNLLPTHQSMNAKKSDKIPSPVLIEKSKANIKYYWRQLSNTYPILFEEEIRRSLAGNDIESSNLIDFSIKRLKSTCSYLIEFKGYNVWNG
jgi:hypothetical protein